MTDIIDLTANQQTFFVCYFNKYNNPVIELEIDDNFRGVIKNSNIDKRHIEEGKRFIKYGIRGRDGIFKFKINEELNFDIKEDIFNHPSPIQINQFPS